jgi:hypothetical protein
VYSPVAADTTMLAIAVHAAPRMSHRNVPQITRNVK